MSVEATALLLAWVAILILAFALAGLLRQLHVLRAQVRDPSARTGPLLPGTAVAALLPLSGERPAAVMFVDRGCATCTHLLSEFEQAARTRMREGAQLLVLFPDSANGFRSEAAAVHHDQAEVFRELKITLLPYGLITDAQGRVVAAQPLASPADLRRLLTHLDPAADGKGRS